MVLVPFLSTVALLQAQSAISQKTVSLATRGNLTFTPTLTFPLYAEPFMSSGRFLTFKRVTDPAGRNDRIRGNLGSLFGAQANNTLILKVSYWVSR